MTDRSRSPVRQVRESLRPPCSPGGESSWVAPATDAAGRDLGPKVGWAHPESAHEADGR
jgi:streptomycin 6-kinase